LKDLFLILQDTEVSVRPPARSLLLQKQMPGLDVLRGVAILAVVFFHGLGWSIPEHTSITPAARMLGSATHAGWLGVNLFFVISGFLITGILLDTRHQHNYRGNFYVRRALRILPLYLATLLLAKFALGLHAAYIVMCVFYAANLDVYFHSIGPNYSPLWSLAVEEQFYLVWPLFIRSSSRRVLTCVCLGLAVVSPILRGLSVNRFQWLGDAYSTTWLVCDNLAWGALIAIFLRSHWATSRSTRLLTASLSLISVALFAVLAGLHLLTRRQSLGAALQPVPFLALFCVMLLLALRFGRHPQVLRWSAPIRFFGYISYGLYLLHLLFFLAYDVAVRHYRAPGELTARVLLTRFAVVLVAGSVICFLSRRFFEEKFLLMKERLVPYNKRKPVARALQMPAVYAGRESGPQTETQKRRGHG
jgi:peptidoglycan/LPS O-acetylase OafA/YrhL